VVGAAMRFAAPGEWRTNIALGARSMATTAPPDACELALAATAALGIDLAGVDLLPDGDGWVVIEVNGAVDMRRHYALEGDVFGAAVRGLERKAQEPLLLPAAGLRLT
jgi:glutathione synthase/RimK-type ligase-like ATP-grasp enzyme